MTKKKKVEVKRVNFFMPIHLYEFVKSESEKTGITFTGYMNLLVKQAQKEESVISMSDILHELKNLTVEK